MNNLHSLICILSALILVTSTMANDYPHAINAHKQRAIQIAGEDLKFLAEGVVCQPAATQIPYAMKNIPGFLDPAAPAVEPFAAFDNLYYVGLYAVGTWILDTGDGLILFDALNNEREVKNVLLPGMRELGLDPEEIKYVIVTHAHFDHYGGADFLKQEFGPRIVMSGPDWDYLASDISLPYAIRAGYPEVTQPARDMVMQDGEVLEMGDATIRFIVTPGHSPGTLSSIISVRDRGRKLNIGMWGGQALPGELEPLSQMHDSLHKFWTAATGHGTEAAISTHPWVVGNFEMQAQARLDGGNPLLIGTDGFDRVMAIYEECINAQFARSVAAGAEAMSNIHNLKN